MITETTAVLAENIPTELMERHQWICWRYEERDEELTKVPYTPGTGRRASTTDPTTWRPFADAWQFVRDPKLASICDIPPYDGLGFVFTGEDPFAGIDLDHCQDPETGEIEQWAREILEDVGDEAYVEASPSGEGVHIIVKGAVRNGGVRHGDVELYSRGRYFTITGRTL